jgi:hypothetical protein
MTLNEILIFIAGAFVLFALLFGFLFLIIRRVMNKPLKKERECDHYHESGLGDPGGTNLHDPTHSHGSPD